MLEIPKLYHKKRIFFLKDISQFKVLQLQIKSIWSLSWDDIFTQTPVLFQLFLKWMEIRQYRGREISWSSQI